MIRTIENNQEAVTVFLDTGEEVRVEYSEVDKFEGDDRLEEMRRLLRKRGVPAAYDITVGELPNESRINVGVQLRQEDTGSTDWSERRITT